MQNLQTFTGLVKNMNRLDSSRNGNPRYECTVGGNWVATAVDSSLGYSITNWENKSVTVVAGIHYGRMTIKSIAVNTDIVFISHEGLSDEQLKRIADMPGLFDIRKGASELGVPVPNETFDGKSLTLWYDGEWNLSVDD